MDSDPIVLTVDWTALRLSDFKIFSTPTAWINDDSINFYYEHLTQTKKPENIILVSASTGALMVYESAAELKDILAELEITSFKYWLIPINDKVDPTTTGGLHWSLLFYDGTNFHHLDSMGRSANLKNAEVVAKKLSELYLDNRPVKVTMVTEYPKQVNSYDCGMYVIAATEKILDDALVGKEDLLDGLKDLLTPEYIKKRRQELYTLFVNMLKEQNKPALGLLKKTT